jgi:Glycosyltransferase family 9 (heptosyltransferase)
MTLKPLQAESNLLILLLNGYGDCFLALPVLREIQRRFTSKRVCMVSFNDEIDALFGDLDFNFIRGNRTSQSCSTLETERFDFEQIVSLNAYFPCSIESELTAGRQRLPRWAFCDLNGDALKLDHLHMRDQYFHVLGWQPLYSDADRQVFLSNETSTAVEEIIREWIGTLGANFYAIHLDSLPEKLWPTNSWIDVVDYMWSRWGAWPILLGEESEQAAILLQRFSYARKLLSSIGISSHFAAVKLARAFVGIDSIFAHIADSYGLPNVILFGPSDPVVWGPVNKNSRLVIARNQELSNLAPLQVKQQLDALLRSGSELSSANGILERFNGH